MREQMNIVVVGHVDHGKSTVIGRLLADTNSLPEGKLEQVQERCKRESKVFEYAFLLDALKDEQSQGITIDSARCFFKTKKRDYIIIDAPGHIEFLKNMVSGAARAEAAVLVIDADEGIKENSHRHGYLLGMLGIKQVIVCVNKMDLVDYDQQRFENIVKEYGDFLKSISITPKTFIPVSALKGENIASESSQMPWFTGGTILDAVDSFSKEEPLVDKPLRLPVQDIYKFTKAGDARRIVAGRIESGQISVGDEIVFLPSNKHSTVASIEAFAKKEQSSAVAGESVGITLNEQIYINRGDVITRKSDPSPLYGTQFKANIFWMSRENLELNKMYKLKIGTASVPAKIIDIVDALDASTLTKTKKSSVERYEVAECVLETSSPIAFDLYVDAQSTGRFVLVDNYNISGGGIIVEHLPGKLDEYRKQVESREEKWYRGSITMRDRGVMYSQSPHVIVLTGDESIDKKIPAELLERALFTRGQACYFLSIGNLLRGVDVDVGDQLEHVRRLAEITHILVDAGLLVIATASNLTDEHIDMLKAIHNERQAICIDIGSNLSTSDLHLQASLSADEIVDAIMKYLVTRGIIFDIGK